MLPLHQSYFAQKSHLIRRSRMNCDSYHCVYVVGSYTEGLWSIRHTNFPSSSSDQALVFSCPHSSHTCNIQPAEASPLRWHRYVLLSFIPVYVLVTLCFSLFSPWKFIFLTLTLLILFRVHNDFVFVPYKPSTTVLFHTSLALCISLSFILGPVVTNHYLFPFNPCSPPSQTILIMATYSIG